MSAAAPLIEYLKQLQAKGQTHVSLDTGARAIMREFYFRAVKGASRSAEPARQQPAAASQPMSQPIAEVQPIKLETAAEGADNSQLLASLRSSCESFKPLQQLGTLRKKIVFPAPSSEAKILFCGEAPSYHDERHGLPFSGPAGEKLNGILKAMGLSRANVHVTNILKYRPSVPNQTTNNRPASAQEMAVVKPLIDQEIQSLRPQLIISLGANAAKFFLGDGVEIDDARGTQHSYLGIPLISTYHPSFLLHSEDTKDKRALWEDMLRAMELMEMPISERQRGYFKKPV